MTATLPSESVERTAQPVLIECTRGKLGQKKYCVIVCDDNDEEGVRLYVKQRGLYAGGIDWVEYPGPTHSLQRDLTAEDRLGVFVRHVTKYRQLHKIEEIWIFVHGPCGN